MTSIRSRMIGAAAVDYERNSANIYQILQSVRNFRRMHYPRLVECLSIEDLKKILQSIDDRDYPDKIDVSTLKQDLDFAKFFDHDIGTLWGGLSFSLQNFRRKINSKDSIPPLESFQKVLSLWVEFSLIMEDVLSHKLHASEHRWAEQELVQSSFANQVISSFEKRLNIEMQKDIHSDLNRRGYNPLGELDRFSIENSAFIPPVVLNIVFNIIRNACRFSVQAGEKKVKFTIENQPDKLRLQVTDNGVGMMSDQLNSDSDEYIFKKGVSGEGSSGIGLAQAPERLEGIAKASICVASRKKDLNSGTYGKVSFTANVSLVDRERLEKILTDDDLSTIFEIQLPVPSKENN